MASCSPSLKHETPTYPAIQYTFNFPSPQLRPSSFPRFPLTVDLCVLPVLTDCGVETVLLVETCVESLSFRSFIIFSCPVKDLDLPVASDRIISSKTN